MSGKRTRNPGWQNGQHWVVCDRCEDVVRKRDVQKEWTGLVVCKECFEQKHEQEYVRGRPEKIAADQPLRPEPEDNYIEVTGATPPESLPPGTNDNEL